MWCITRRSLSSRQRGRSAALRFSPAAVRWAANRRVASYSDSHYHRLARALPDILETISRCGCCGSAVEVMTHPIETATEEPNSLPAKTTTRKQMHHG